MSDDLINQWDEYVESMGSVMGEVEHMAQQMRDRIEELECERYEAVNAAWRNGIAREKAQAKLAKAVETLRCLEIAATGAGVPHPQERKLLHEQIALTRTTLAELGEGRND